MSISHIAVSGYGTKGVHAFPKGISSKMNVIGQLELGLSKLVTLVEGDPKASFSVATTSRCRGGRMIFIIIIINSHT